MYYGNGEIANRPSVSELLFALFSKRVLLRNHSIENHFD